MSYDTRSHRETQAARPRPWLSYALMAAILVLLPLGGTLYAALFPRTVDASTASDLLMAARCYAAVHSDGRGLDMTWCEQTFDPTARVKEGAITYLGRGRYRTRGCVVGTWQGRQAARRFEAVIEDRPGSMFVTDLPVLEFRFLDP